MPELSRHSCAWFHSSLLYSCISCTDLKSVLFGSFVVIFNQIDSQQSEKHKSTNAFPEYWITSGKLRSSVSPDRKMPSLSTQSPRTARYLRVSTNRCPTALNRCHFEEQTCCSRMRSKCKSLFIEANRLLLENFEFVFQLIHGFYNSELERFFYLNYDWQIPEKVL